MSLAEQQAAFIEAIRPDGKQDGQGLFKQRAPMTAEQRLEVYRHNISGGQIRALECTFPVLADILGERSFAKLAREYAWAVGSPEPDLNTLGHKLADYIEAHLLALPAFAELPYLGDLARLEWAWSQAHLAEDDPAFDTVRFEQAIANGQPVRFRLSYALKLLISDYPVLTIWQAHRDGEPLGHLAAARSGMVVWRTHDQVVYADAIPLQEADALSRLSGDDDLLTVIEQSSGIPFDAYLPVWVAKGWLAMRDADDEAKSC